MAGADTAGEGRVGLNAPLLPLSQAYRKAAWTRPWNVLLLFGYIVTISLVNFYSLLNVFYPNGDEDYDSLSAWFWGAASLSFIANLYGNLVAKGDVISNPFKEFWASTKMPSAQVAEQKGELRCLEAAAAFAKSESVEVIILVAADFDTLSFSRKFLSFAREHCSDLKFVCPSIGQYGYEEILSKGGRQSWHPAQSQGSRKAGLLIPFNASPVPHSLREHYAIGNSSIFGLHWSLSSSIFNFIIKWLPSLQVLFTINQAGSEVFFRTGLEHPFSKRGEAVFCISLFFVFFGGLRAVFNNELKIPPAQRFMKKLSWKWNYKFVKQDQKNTCCSRDYWCNKRLYAKIGLLLLTVISMASTDAYAVVTSLFFGSSGPTRFIDQLWGGVVQDTSLNADSSLEHIIIDVFKYAFTVSAAILYTFTTCLSTWEKFQSYKLMPTEGAEASSKQNFSCSEVVFWLFTLISSMQFGVNGYFNSQKALGVEGFSWSVFLSLAVTNTAWMAYTRNKGSAASLASLFSRRESEDIRKGTGYPKCCGSCC